MRRAAAPVLALCAIALVWTAEAREPSRWEPVPQGQFRPIQTAAAPSPTRPEATVVVDTLRTRHDRPGRPLVPQEAARARSEPVRTARPAAPRLGRSIRGLASWYCRAGVSICHYAYPDRRGADLYAAAGPRLRRAVGAGWRNDVVTVCGQRCARVRLVDWCECHGGESGVEKLIDLYWDAWTATGGGTVTVSW